MTNKVKQIALKLLVLCIIISSGPTIPVYAVPRDTGKDSKPTGGGVTWGDYVDETRTAKIKLQDSTGNKIQGTAEIVFPMEKVYDEMRVTVLHSVNAYLAQQDDIYFIPELADFPVEPKKLFSNVLMADSAEDSSPTSGSRKRFADVVDDYFDTEVKMTAVIGEAAREQNFVNAQGQSEEDGEVKKIGRFNTSKKVYSKNENSRTLQVLGYDILLANEQCIMSTNGKSFFVDYAPTYAKSSLSTKHLTADTIMMDLYKAVGEYIWDIKCQFTDDSSISVENTPLDLPTDHLTARADIGGVHPRDAACWVWASRTNPELYWDAVRKDRIFGGSQNVKTQHMYAGETYSVTFNKLRTSTMTLGEFCAVARAMMELYGEPVMTEREQLIMLQVYGFSLPDNLTTEQSNAVRYMVAKGIIDPTNVDFHKTVTFDDISELLLRIADKSARLTFKEAQSFNTNSVLFKDGFVSGALEDVADINDIGEVADLDNDPYYDYFVESEDGFSNFFLLNDTSYGAKGNVVADEIGIDSGGADAEYNTTHPKPSKKQKKKEPSPTSRGAILMDYDGTLDKSPGSKIDDPIDGIDYLRGLLLEAADDPNLEYAFCTAGGKLKERQELISMAVDPKANKGYNRTLFDTDGDKIWTHSFNYKSWDSTKIKSVGAAAKRAKFAANNNFTLLIDDNRAACKEFAQYGGYAICLDKANDKDPVSHISEDGHIYFAPEAYTAEAISWAKDKLGMSPKITKDDTEDVDDNAEYLPVFVNQGITEDGFYHFRILKSFYNDTITQTLQESGDSLTNQDMNFSDAVDVLRSLVSGDIEDGWDIDSDKIVIGEDEAQKAEMSEEEILNNLQAANNMRIYLQKNKVGLVNFTSNKDVIPTTFQCSDPHVAVQPQTIVYKNKLLKTIAIKSNQAGIYQGTIKAVAPDNSQRDINITIEVVDKQLPRATYKTKKGKDAKYNALLTSDFFKDYIHNPQKATCIVADNNKGEDNLDYNLKIQTKSKKISKKNKANYNTKQKAKFYIPNCTGAEVIGDVTGYQNVPDGSESYSDPKYETDGKNGFSNGIKIDSPKNNVVTITVTCVDKDFTLLVHKSHNDKDQKYTIHVEHVTSLKTVDGLIDISYVPSVVSESTGYRENVEEEIVATIDNAAGDPELEDTVTEKNSYNLEAGGGVYLLEQGDPTISKDLNPDKQYVMRYTLDGQFLTAYEWDPIEFSVATSKPDVDQTSTVMAILFAKGWVHAYNSAASMIGEDYATVANEKQHIIETLSKNGMNVGSSASDLEDFVDDFDRYNRLTFTLDKKYIDSSRVFLNTIYRGFLDKYNGISEKAILEDPDALSYAPLDIYTTGIIFQIPKKTWDKGNFGNYTFGGASIPLDELKASNTIGAKQTQSYTGDNNYTLTFIIQDISDSYVNIAVQGVTSLDVFKQLFKAPANSKNYGVSKVYYDASATGSHDVMIDVNTLHNYKLIKTAMKQKDGSIFLVTSDGNNIILYQKGTTGRVWVGDTVFLLPQDQKAFVESGSSTYVNVRCLMGWGTKSVSLVESNGKIQIVLPSKAKLNKVTDKNVSVTTLYGATDSFAGIKGYNGKQGLRLATSYGLSNYLVVIDQRNNTGNAARLIGAEDANDYVFYWTPKMKYDTSEVLTDDKAAHDKLSELGLKYDGLDRQYYGLHMIKLHREEKPTKETGQLGWAAQTVTGLDGDSSAKSIFGYVYYPVGVAGSNITGAMKSIFSGDSATAVPIIQNNKKYYNLLPNGWENENGLYMSDKAPGFALGYETPQTETQATGDSEDSGEGEGDDSSDKNNTLSGNQCYMYKLTGFGGKWEKDENIPVFDINNGKLILAPTGAFSSLHGTVTMKLKQITDTDSKIYAGTQLAKRSGTDLKIGNVVVSRKADNLVVNLSHAKSKTSGFYTVTPSALMTNGTSALIGELAENLSMAKVLTDWDKYKFSSLVSNIDSASSIFLILILNLLPRIGMLAFFVLMLLTTLQGNKIAELFCEKVFDPVKILTFNRQSFTTLDLKVTVIQSMLALSLFLIVMDGHLLVLIEWSVKFFGVLLNR